MKLIDSDALNHEYYKNPSYANLCKAINNAPIIDAVPVVRCKECKYLEKSNRLASLSNGIYFNCRYWEHGDYAPVKELDYCSKGERADG